MTKKPFFSGEPFERLVGLLIGLVTIIAALAAFLEADAGSRSDIALRNAQQFALQAVGVRSRGEVQTGYAWTDAYRLWLELDALVILAAEADDAPLSQQYRNIRDDLSNLTPLLQPPYFDPASDDFPNVNAFEADTYLVEATALTERFAYQTAVSEAWGNKADTYVAHLTLLTVALFLYGLSTTIVGRMSLLFVGMGSLMALVTVVWLVFVVLTPIPFLPETAIIAFADGTGLAFEDDHAAAETAFATALAAAPDYANAYYERAKVHFAQGDLAAAAADYEAALENGREDINVSWNLGWTYYLLGDYPAAKAMTETALALQPEQVALHFNLGLIHLASGTVEQGEEVYARGMETAVSQVNIARAANAEPPATLWWYLDTAVYDLVNLQSCWQEQLCQHAPPLEQLAISEQGQTAGQRLAQELRELTVTLEYFAEEPETTAAEIGELAFAQAVFDEAGTVVDYQALPTDTSQLRFGTVFEDEGEAANFALSREATLDNLVLLFDYEQLATDELVVIKLRTDGREATGLRVAEPWRFDSSGQAAIPLLSDNSFGLATGDYEVELYVNGRLRQQGEFAVP